MRLKNTLGEKCCLFAYVRFYAFYMLFVLFVLFVLFLCVKQKRQHFYAHKNI